MDLELNSFETDSETELLDVNRTRNNKILIVNNRRQNNPKKMGLWKKIFW
jgi:hypothetical protein